MVVVSEMVSTWKEGYGLDTHPCSRWTLDP